MGAPQPLPLILVDWCRSLLSHHFLWPDYRDRPAAPGGAALIDELALQMASEMAAQFARQDIVHVAPAIMAAQRDAPDQRQLNIDATARARHCYLTRLHADLSDRPAPGEDGAPGKPSPRHLDAQAELRFVAAAQLISVKSNGKNPWTYAGAVAYFRSMNYTGDDFQSDFWEDIWPDILDGRHSAGHTPIEPATPDDIVIWLKRRARAFLSHKIRKLYRQYAELVTFERSLGQEDDSAPGQEQELGEQASIVSDAAGSFATEPVALGHFDEEALLRLVLEALVKSSRANRLGFLIFLLLLDLRDLDDKRLGPTKKKQIAELLNRWKTDRAALWRYLTDPEDGIGLDDDLAAEITEAIEPGFAAFTGPIIPLRVGDLLDEFYAAMREHLDRDRFSPPPPDATPGDGDSRGGGQ